MAINVGVQCNGGFLPNILLLILCYYHRETRLNAIELNSFCPYSLNSHLNVLIILPPIGECPEGLDVFRLFYKNNIMNERIRLQNTEILADRCNQ